MADPRTARQVIDQAIKENRFGEWLCYGFAITFVAVGVGVIAWSLFAGLPVSTFIGGVISALFYPAIHAARQIRKENLAIRLLELPLSRAGTAQAAANALREAFVEIFISEGGGRHGEAQAQLPRSG